MENTTNTTSNSYLDLITTMMFGFGDNKTPNPETVRFVESVLLKQLRDILYEASKNADRRNLKTVNADDLLFLMRRDRHKMQRFMKYMELKYTISTINCNNDTTQFSDATKAKMKKLDALKSIVINIDETGELLDINEFDNIKHDRMLRAERISSALDEEKYKEYSKARQVSFSNKRFSKNSKSFFRQWIDPQNEINFSQSATEILELLAYGIVGHITDMALIIRQNSRQMAGDPLQMLTGSFYNSSMFNAPHLSNKETSIGLGQPPITVREVREVLRRFYCPQVGFVSFSNKSILGKRKLMMY